MLLAALMSLALAAPSLPSIDLGEPAPLFVLPAINEQVALKVVGRTQVELGEFVGVTPRIPSKAVVLYFYDQAHGGDELPTLNRLQRHGADHNIHVMAISADKGEIGPIASAIDKQRIQVPVLRDEHGVVQSRYGVTPDSLPLTLVVDGSGRLFAVGQPGAADLESAIMAELDAFTK